jgi:hypothetical protein
MYKVFHEPEYKLPLVRVSCNSCEEGINAFLTEHEDKIMNDKTPHYCRKCYSEFSNSIYDGSFDEFLLINWPLMPERLETDNVSIEIGYLSYWNEGNLTLSLMLPGSMTYIKKQEAAMLGETLTKMSAWLSD